MNNPDQSPFQLGNLEVQYIIDEAKRLPQQSDTEEQYMKDLVSLWSHFPVLSAYVQLSPLHIVEKWISQVRFVSDTLLYRGYTYSDQAQNNIQRMRELIQECLDKKWLAEAGMSMDSHDTSIGFRGSDDSGVNLSIPDDSGVSLEVFSDQSSTHSSY